jgi:hypothetical protein
MRWSSAAVLTSVLALLSPLGIASGEVAQVPQLRGFDLTGLELPQASGQPFSTTVPLDGQPYSLDLEPHSLRAPDFQLLVDRGDGQLNPVEPGPPCTYRGTVRGVAGSRVAASLIDGELRASIHLAADDIWHLEPLRELAGPGSPAGVYAIYRGTDVAAPLDRWCGVTEEIIPPDDNAGSGAGIASTGLRIIDYAADADVEFWQKNAGSVQATMYDIELVVNTMENIFEDQLDLTFEITTIVVRTGSTGDDPYSSNTCSTLLGQLRSTWRTSPEVSIRRDVAQLYTGKNLADCLGISYLATTCDNQWHYSVVESRAPGLTLNLRTVLSAHNLGHTFNATHCDGDADCGIMCSVLGGCAGTLAFGSRAIREITSFAGSIGCLSDLESPPAVPFFDDFPGPALSQSNWSYSNGAVITTDASNEPSEPYSLNLDSSGGGPYEDDEVRSNFIDLTGLDNDGIKVSYHTEHQGVEAGETLTVEYWAGGLWNELNTIVSDGKDQTDFTHCVHDLTGLFPSPFHPEFRLRFRSGGNALDDDWYIDDVFIGFEPCPWDCEDPPDGTVDVGDFLALVSQWGNVGSACDVDGGGVSVTDFLALLAHWGPCPPR